MQNDALMHRNGLKYQFGQFVPHLPFHVVSHIIVIQYVNVNKIEMGTCPKITKFLRFN